MGTLDSDVAKELTEKVGAEKTEFLFCWFFGLDNFLSSLCLFTSARTSAKPFKTKTMSEHFDHFYSRNLLPLQNYVAYR